MNKIKILIGIAVLVLAMVSRAQSTNAPVATTNAPQNFFQTAEDYLTTFTTNGVWTNTLEISTGYKQVVGQPASDMLEGQYDMGNFNIGAVFGFDGVGSAVNSEEAQVGYAVVNHMDTKIDIDLRGGYDHVINAIEIEPAIELKKKLTTNTYTEVGISFPAYIRHTFDSTPDWYLAAGFTY